MIEPPDPVTEFALTVEDESSMRGIVSQLGASGYIRSIADYDEQELRATYESVGNRGYRGSRIFRDDSLELMRRHDHTVMLPLVFHLHLRQKHNEIGFDLLTDESAGTRMASVISGQHYKKLVDYYAANHVEEIVPHPICFITSKHFPNFPGRPKGESLPFGTLVGIQEGSSGPGTLEFNGIDAAYIYSGLGLDTHGTKHFQLVAWRNRFPNYEPFLDSDLLAFFEQTAEEAIEINDGLVSLEESRLGEMI